MSEILQDNLLLRVKSPLPADSVFLGELEGTETVSRPFRFRLELLSTDAELDLDALLGQSLTVEVQVEQGKVTHLNGVVSRVRQLGMSGEFALYEAELVPKIWELGLRVNSRIFQEKSALDIVKSVLDEHAVKYKVSASAPGKREYCVQYQESDLDFVSRLLEEEGIHYYHTHADGSHELVLSDDSTGAPNCPQVSTYELIHGMGAAWSSGFVESFEYERSLRSGVHAMSDYNFETPTTDLTVSGKGEDKPEVFEYPGRYPDRSTGDSLARNRAEEHAWPRELASGTGSCRTMRCGTVFSLAEHPSRDGDYFLVQVWHRASQSRELQAHRPADQGPDADERAYDVRFTAVPKSVRFRPPRITPKPRIFGAQPAVVVGKSGEEIWTDKYGRIKVHFPWDREGKNDGGDTCWIRCAFGVAGMNWGQIFIPRVGQEVLVGFLDGDPDRPLVLGGVYNAQQMPPYSLPGDQTKSTLKSRSSKKGAAKNFNEIRFEDKKGSEEVYVQAEKDMVRLVKNDDKLEVQNDQTIEITNNRTETVKKGNEQVTISKGNRTVTVSMGNDTHRIKKGNRSVTLDMGNDTLTIKMGNQTTKLNLGKATTQAMQSIELKVGASSLKVDQMGVTIKGTMVKIQANAMAEVKGTMTTVQGSAMLKAAGGIIMIG